MKKRLLMSLLAVVGVCCIFAGCGDRNDGGGGACVHEFVNVSETPATCVSAKTILQRCSKCGHEETITEGTALGHLLNDTPETTTPPTCVETGLRTYPCQREGCTYVEEERYGAALGHDYIEETIREGTCDNPGLKRVTCSRCDYEAETEIVIDHEYEIDAAQHADATCTADGKDVYKCKNCTSTYEELIPAKGHTDDGTLNEQHAATCQETGYNLRHCSVCEENYRTDITPIVAHDYDDDGICSMCGGSIIDIEQSVISGDALSVVYDTEKGSWTVTGEVSPNMAFVNLTFTVTAEKLAALKAEGWGAVDMIINTKEGQEATSFQVFKDSASGEHLYTMIMGQPAPVIRIDLSANTLEDQTYLVSYRSHNNPGITDGYVVSFKGITAFDPADVSTWWSGSAEMTAEGGAITASAAGTGSVQYGITLRPEAVQYFIDEGHTAIRFDVVSANTTETYLNAWASGQNLYVGATHGVFFIENLEDYAEDGIVLHFVVYNSMGTASVTVTAAGDKAFDPEDVSTYFSTYGGVSYTVNGDLAHFDVEGKGQQIYYVSLRAQAAQYFKAHGMGRIVFSFSSEENTLLEVYRDRPDPSMRYYTGNYAGIVDLEITSAMEVRGVAFCLVAHDRGNEGKHSVDIHTRAEKAFEEGDYSTYVNAPQGTGVSLEFTEVDPAQNDGYFFSVDGEPNTTPRTVSWNGYEMINISASAIKYFRGNGYDKLTITVKNKAGQSGLFGMYASYATVLVEVSADTTNGSLTYTVALTADMERTGFNFIIVYDTNLADVPVDGFMLKAEFTQDQNPLEMPFDENNLLTWFASFDENDPIVVTAAEIIEGGVNVKVDERTEFGLGTATSKSFNLRKEAVDYLLENYASVTFTVNSYDGDASQVGLYLGNGTDTAIVAAGGAGNMSPTAGASGGSLTPAEISGALNGDGSLTLTAWYQNHDANSACDGVALLIEGVAAA